VPESTSLTEHLSRWLASRSTRRSFLGKLGRGAVLVAGGSTIATLLVGDEAEARVCGQSGVSPKCATYDCDDGVWGWCWYATGCCAGGELKKICDCCVANHPNVHGYCPTGTNVYCIVESCGADPRVQVVGLRRILTDDVVVMAAGASRLHNGDGGATEVWMVEAGQAVLASVLTPVAARRGIPVLFARGVGLGAHLIAELQRLGTKKVVLRGPGLTAGVEADLLRYGITVERLDPDGSLAAISTLSEGLAGQLRGTGVRRAVCVESSGMSLDAAPLAAALAASKGYPLIVGVDKAKIAGFTLVYLVGPEAAARAGEVPGGHPIGESSWAALSVAVADIAFRVEGAGPGGLALVADGGPGPLGLLPAGGPILMHVPGSLEGVRDALFAGRDRVRSVALGGATGALETEAYYELQSIVNGFEAHKLIGVSGQGLPVIDQPVSERPLGLARRSNVAPVELGPQYWTGRGLELESP
jgi:hypothetical protein